MWNTTLEKKVSNMFLERKLSSNNLSCGWPLLLAMTVKVTHLLLFFLEAPPESCQPPIPHSRPWLPAGSQAEGHQQAPWARALGMVCSAHILGWFHTYWAVFWVMLWTSTEMSVQMALSWKPCFSMCVFILITVTLLRNWQITDCLV